MADFFRNFLYAPVVLIIHQENQSFRHIDVIGGESRGVVETVLERIVERRKQIILNETEEVRVLQGRL